MLWEEDWYEYWAHGGNMLDFGITYWEFREGMGHSGAFCLTFADGVTLVFGHGKRWPAHPHQPWYLDMIWTPDGSEYERVC